MDCSERDFRGSGRDVETLKPKLFFESLSAESFLEADVRMGRVNVFVTDFLFSRAVRRMCFSTSECFWARFFFISIGLCL